MKKILLFFFTIPLSISLYGQIETSIMHLSDLYTQGKVKSIKQRVYKAIAAIGQIKKGNITDEQFYIGDDFLLKKSPISDNYYIEFDTKGRAIREDYIAFGDVYIFSTIYEKDGSHQFLNQYEISGKYNSTKEANSYNINNAKFICKSIYTFNRQGHPISSIKYNDNRNEIGKETSTYDSHGNMLTYREYESKKLSNVITNTYIYNSFDSIIYETNKERNFGLTTSRYTYNKTHKCIKDVQNLNGKLSTFVMSYNSTGNLIKTISYNGKRKIRLIKKYTYDNQGRLLTYISKDPSTGKIYSTESHNYDTKKLNFTEKDLSYINHDYQGISVKNGLVSYCFKNDDVFTYVYSNFDNNGNWTKVIEYKNSIPIIIEEREIDYYTTFSLIN